MGVVGTALLTCIAGSGVAAVVATGTAGAATTYTEVAGFPVDSAVGATSVSLTTGAANDLVVLFIETHTGASVTGVSATNIAWTGRAATDTFGSTLRIQLWYGKATSAGTATTTVTFTKTPTSPELIADSFHASTGTTWRTVAASSLQTSKGNTATSTPSLTSGASGGVYSGYLWFNSSYTSAGTTKTAGFNYFATPQFNLEVSNHSLAASTAYSAAAKQAAAAPFTSIAGIFATAPASPMLPTVTKVTPASGPTAGGNTVTITGTNFQSGDTVDFGATAGTVTGLTATSITAVAPAGAAGTVDVRVTDVGGGGQSAVSAADQYTYRAPTTVTSVSPAQGKVRGGNIVTVTGKNLTSTDEARFGGVGSSKRSPVKSTSFTVYAPKGTATATVDVTLHSTSGTTSAVSATDKYKYVKVPPTVTKIGPVQGPSAGGTTVTITGTNFSPAEKVYFGATASPTVTPVAASKVTPFTHTLTTFTQLTAVAPAGTAGTVPVTVVTATTGTSNATVMYKYVATALPAPTVTGVNPNTGPATGGTKVTVTGTNFNVSPNTAVFFAGVAATTVHVTSATSLTATSPAGSGVANVVVTDGGRASAQTTADQFTYQASSGGGTKGGTGSGTKRTKGGTGSGTKGSTGGTKPVTPPVTKSSGSGGYELVGSDGGVFDFTAPFHGSMGAQHLNAPIVGLAQVPGGGYYEVASDGGIFAFTAPFHGSMGAQHLNAPIVGIAYDTLTGGYYEVASDGGIFAFTAPFHGSMGGTHINQPVVGIAFDPATGGYYEVASDGGIFAFTAPFHGSMGGTHINQPVVGIAFDPATGGYYEVAADGGMFAFTVPFDGSMGGTPLNQPVVAMSVDPNGGYWEFARDGGVFAFGGAPSAGSLPGLGIHVANIVGAAPAAG